MIQGRNMSSNTEEKSVPFTTVDEVQQGIIDSFDLEEPAKSQLLSYADYLNLPWNDLGEFTSMVRKHEDEFQKQVGKLDFAARTKEYLEKYPFHIFNCPITESPWDIQMDLDFGLFRDVAIKLLRLNQWKDLRDYRGKIINSDNTYKFLENLSTRILNLQYLIPYVLPNSTCQGSDSIFKDYDKLTNMSIKMISPEDCFNNRFELYFYYFNPQTIFRKRNDPIPITQNTFDDTPQTDQVIRSSSICTIMNYVKNIFCDSVFANKDDGIRFSLEGRPLFNDDGEFLSLKRSSISKLSNNLTSIDSQTKNEGDLDDLKPPQKFIRFFNRRNIQSFGKPYEIVHLCKRTSKTQDFYEIFEASFKFAIFEIKLISEIGDLAISFFSRLERSIAKKKAKRVFLKDADTDHVDKSRNVLEDKDEDFKEHSTFYQKELDQFNEFLVQAISHCKTVGCPVTIITNGDDYVIVYIEDYYKKLKKYTEKFPNHDIYGDWRVCIIKRNEYPILLALSSVFMSQFNDYISHCQLTNLEIMKWYQTYGKVEKLKILDMNKFLINRKVFHDLFFDRVLNTVDAEEMFNTSWKENDEICLVLQLANPSKLMNQFVKNIIQNIKTSYTFKIFDNSVTKESPLIPIGTFNSQDFQIIDFLQNETIDRRTNATVIHATHNQQIGVLKMFDTTRIPCFNKRFIQFKNGYNTNQDFEGVLKLCFKMFMSEHMAYNLLGEKDYLPKIYHSGVLYIPNLSSSTAIQTIDLYEDPFSTKGKNEKVKSDSMFLFMEKIVEKAVSEDFDFDKLAFQALKDLDEIHSLGVIHRDISQRNIIFKESKTTETGLRVVFLDFGLCHIMKNGFKHKSLNDKELEKFIKKPIEWRERRQEFSYEKWRYWPDEEIDKLNDKEQEILYERLRVIDREDLKEALALEMIG